MSGKITIQLFFVLFVASVLILPTAAGAPTSSRTLPTPVNVGAPFTVSIDVADYGLFGLVVETIPDGFIYVESSLDVTQAEETGNTVRFSLMGESSFDYTLIASSNENTYTFSGIIKDEYENEFTIGGDTSIILVAEAVEQVNDPTPDEQTSTPNVQTTQVESESVESETIDEILDESVENETSVDDVTIESPKSVKATTSTESEEIPASEATPFITTFGVIVIGIIATFVHKMKK